MTFRSQLKRLVVRRAASVVSEALQQRAHRRVGRTGGGPDARLGGIDTTYAPEPDGQPDPGEVVWAWVPYEDDPHQGKDRPVLLIGRAGPGRWYGLHLSGQDHRVDAQQEARAGRYWFHLGTGPWDSKGRPSSLRLNRVLTLRADDIRREGAVLDRERYERVIAAARQYLP